MRKWFLVCSTGFVMACWVKSSPAQTSELFITTSDTDDIFVVQAGLLIRQWKTAVSRLEWPIAVIDTVRTTGDRPGRQGAEYTLDGNDTGERFPHPGGDIDQFHDGATDGEFNYGVECCEQGRVFRTDLEWANSEVLFSVGRGFAGIAFDATDNSLWLGSHPGGRIIEHRALDGELIGSVETKSQMNSGLALDPADDTLWVAEGERQGRLRQYSKSGELLQDLVVDVLIGKQTIGAEFQLNPPPPPARCLYEVTKVKKTGTNGCIESCDDLPYEVGDQICGLVKCEDKSDCNKKAKFSQDCPNGASVLIKVAVIGCTECTLNCSR